MFAKFKESKLYKFLTKPLGCASKGCAKEEEIANSKKESAANPKTTEDSR